MRLNEIQEFATDIANGMLADINTKYKTRDMIVKIVVSACLYYDNDPKFKEQVNSYAKLYL